MNEKEIKEWIEVNLMTKHEIMEQYNVSSSR